MMSQERFYRLMRARSRALLVISVIRWSIRLAILIGVIRWFLMPLDKFIG